MPGTDDVGRAPGAAEQSQPAAIEASVERTDPLTTRGQPPIPSADLVLHNTDDEEVHLEFGGPGGFLVRPGESTAVSVNEYAVAAMLYTVDIPPGGTHEISAGVALASCDPALGYRVPAGDYELVIVIDSVVSERYEVTVTN